MQEKENVLGIENGPSKEDVDKLKAQHGDVFVATFGPDEKYIYRALKRLEYKQVMQLGQTQENRAFVEDKIAQMCIIWPKIEIAQLASGKAGTIPTIVELIMAASNFGITEEPVKL